MAHPSESGSACVGSRIRQLLPLLLVLIAVTGVCLHFCLWKSGLFIDEIYTYGLANSHYMPFIGNGEHDRIEEQLLTRDDFTDYLTVTESDTPFDIRSVYYNQVQDVHPPLYYWLLNFCSSLFRGQFSKWIGLVPDLLLYVLGMELWANPWASSAMAALYGLSRVGLSTMLMIRMYVLMSLLTVLLALLVAKELRKPALKTETAVGITIYLGLMTQYYFIFYAFFLCAASMLVLLCRKAWKAALRFALGAFIGVGLMLVSFPAVFTQMTGQRLGPQSDALANLRDVSAWAGRLRYYFGQVRFGLPAAVLVAAICIALALILALVHREPRFHKGDWRFLTLLLPVIPTIFIPALISPVVEGRYIYNIMPVCSLAAGFAFHWISRHAKIRSIWLLAVMLALAISLRTVPDYIYDEHKDYNAAVLAHSEAPCVYFTGYFAGVTQDMLQLMAFDDVYVTEDPDSEGLRDYLEAEDADELVVYIDVSAMWGSGFQPKEILEALKASTGYSNAEELYRYALSDTFVVRK